MFSPLCLYIIRAHTNLYILCSDWNASERAKFERWWLGWWGRWEDQAWIRYNTCHHWQIMCYRLTQHVFIKHNTLCIVNVRTCIHMCIVHVYTCVFWFVTHVCLLKYYVHTCTCIYTYRYAQSSDSDHPRILCARLGLVLCTIHPSRFSAFNYPNTHIAITCTLGDSLL